MTRQKTAPATTARLKFERLVAAHADELFEPLRDGQAFEHLDEAPAASVVELAAGFARMAAGPPPARSDERWVNLAIRLTAAGTLIGRLQATLIGNRAEVGFLIAPRFWSQGYASEAMPAFQDHLRQHEGIDAFWATTSPRNLRSIRLLKRLGYAESPGHWPDLRSYDLGDLVFTRE